MGPPGVGVIAAMPVKTLAVEAVTAEKGTTIQDLARTMEEEEVGDVIIVEGDEPVGIVTDRDIALAFGRGEDLDSLKAEDLMPGDLTTISADAEADQLPKKLEEGKVRRLPVVDDDGKLVGIVTLDDVVATIGEELDDVASVIEAQSRKYKPSADA